MSPIQKKAPGASKCPWLLDPRPRKNLGSVHGDIDVENYIHQWAMLLIPGDVNKYINKEINNYYIYIIKIVNHN